MRRVLIGFLAMGLCVLGLGAMWIVRAQDADDKVMFAAKLDGFHEVGALAAVGAPNAETGAILTEGKGTLQLTLDKKGQSFSFVLTYSGLSAPVTQAHIHFGQNHVPGGVMVFFCSNLPNAPVSTTCPANGGTVTAMRSAGDVRAITGQNVAAGNFDALTDALFSNSAYANVHTTAFPSGEIRGQIHLERRGHEGDQRK